MISSIFDGKVKTNHQITNNKDIAHLVLPVSVTACVTPWQAKYGYCRAYDETWMRPTKVTFCFPKRVPCKTTAEHVYINRIFYARGRTYNIRTIYSTRDVHTYSIYITTVYQYALQYVKIDTIMYMWTKTMHTHIYIYIHMYVCM
jgi:hypothetical protein